jgi:hypothetical protein
MYLPLPISTSVRRKEKKKKKHLMYVSLRWEWRCWGNTNCMRSCVIWDGHGGSGSGSGRVHSGPAIHFFLHTLHPPPPLAPSHAFLRVGISWRGGSPSILVSFR